MKMMKRILSMLMAVIMILSCWVWIAPEQSIASAADTAAKDHYLFAYFTGNSSDGQTVHLAVSEDGLHYTALRNNEPVIIPSKGTGAVRDPYIWYNEQDNYYYLIGTDMDAADNQWWDNCNGFLMWRSKDLVHWYDETFINVYELLNKINPAVEIVHRAWAPQILWDGQSYIVYFSIDTDELNYPADQLSIVYFRTTDLMDLSKYTEYEGIYAPGSDVNDADIIQHPITGKWYLFYKPEATTSNPTTKIKMMVSDNATGPYTSADPNTTDGLDIFSTVDEALEGCNGYFDNEGNLVVYADAYGHGSSYFYIAKTSATGDYMNWTVFGEDAHNINSLSPRHGSVVKITEAEYNNLLNNANGITSSSFPETEVLSDHLVARYFTTSDYTYNAVTEINDLELTNGTITTTTDALGQYYAVFQDAGAKINLETIIPGDLNINDGFTITFTASASTDLGANARFFDISNNWSQRTDASECYLHMSPVGTVAGLYVGAYNGPVTTESYTSVSQGNNYNDGAMHDYLISFADGNMILYIDGELAMKKNRFNINTTYGANFLTDNWYQTIGNSEMLIGKSEWDTYDPLFDGSIQNFCIYDCSMSYYDIEKMQAQFEEEAGINTTSRIVVPETVYMTPSTGESTVGQYYVNNEMTANTNDVTVKTSTDTAGSIQFYIPGAEQFEVQLNTITSGIGDIKVAEKGDTSGSYENAKFDADDNGYFRYSTLGIYISGTGLTAGSTALAEWVITVYMNDGSTKTYYAYTTLYAPWYQPVGAAVRAFSKGSSANVYGSSILWISGVHSSETSTYSPQTSSFLPMLGILTKPDNNSPTTWIQSGSSGLGATFNYIDTEGSSYHRYGSVVGPTAYLTVDTSRYTNFSQIPNFKVGFMATDMEKSTDGKYYVADYTGLSAYKETKEDNGSDRDPYDTIYERTTGTKLIEKTSGITSSGIYYNDPWDRAIATGTVTLTSSLYSYRKNGSFKGTAWNFNFVDIDVTGVDKKPLRNLVLKATYLNQTDYTDASWNNMQIALRAAAQALGDPTNSNIDTAKSNLQAKMDALQTTVTLNANGGSPATTSFNVTVGTNSTFAYDISGYTCTRTGYVFNGWATSATATNGSTTVTAGLMPTFYAVWAPENVNITFDNLIDFKAWNKVAGNGTVSDITDTGFTITCNNGADEATSSSPFFTVEPGKSYKVDMDITGDGWDVYVFFCDTNGAWIDFVDGTNRYSSGGSGNSSQIFTAPNKSEVVKAQIRVDSNGAGNVVRFENIRVYEANDITYSGVANTYATYSSAYPSTSASASKEGYDFLGWYDGASQYYDANGNATISTAFDKTETLYLTSKFGLNNEALTADTIILDFDRPVTFNPTENDTILNNDADDVKIKGISTDGTTATLNQTELVGIYGDIELNNAGNITYTPTKALDAFEIIYYHIEAYYEGTKYTLVGEINIVPASNVLYEEDKFTTTNTTGVAWETDGTTGTDKQSTSSENDVYGYDTVYNNNAGAYSNGSAKKVTVNSTTKRANIISFDYTGTGFELYSQCGEDTGVMIITIIDKSEGKAVKAFVVDTYYNDDTYGTLKQVPVASYSGGWGDYTINVSSMYLASAGAVKATQTQSVMGFGDMMAYSAPLTGAQMLYEALAEVGMEDVFEADDLEVIWFDDDSVFNGGNGANTLADAQATSTSTTSTATELTCVVDSVRIYEPVLYTGDDFYISTEQGAQYMNIIENIVQDNITMGSGSFAYIEGKGNADFATYEAKGSAEELYLAGDTAGTQAVTFNVAVQSGSRIMLSMRAAYGAPVVKIGGSEFAVSSSTEMYYDITEYVTANDDGTVTVTVQNTGANSLLALNNLKLTGNAAPLATFSLMTARMMMAAPAEEVVPNTPEETPTEPDVEDVPSVDEENTTSDSDTSTDTSTATDEDSAINGLLDFINKLIEFILKIVRTIFAVFSI